ncbi:hypothetical protein [Clostridium sp. MD294]|uniref:hypothetical protein n=1 Tax=Clostridium sp. MD294 TaxID=97138 RepID=UPI0002C91E65|nr:hypothetical protein [Clostridium sp. MD294]NDO45544.1 hypothetical protein [Clostridium sp. MD294]USF30804.1 hypothetical protein C820_002247 [Clostridium sp. MD294]
MKKYFAAFFSTMLILALSACNNVETSMQNTANNTIQNDDIQTNITSDFATQAQKNMENATEITLDCAFGKMTGIYSGETKNNIPHGKGKFVSQNQNQRGWYYEGDFVEGHFEGTGKTVFENGQIQQGTYIKDIWHPNTIQFFEFMQTLPGSDFIINQKARTILTAEKNYFPAQYSEIPSNLIDKNIHYEDIIKNSDEYGDKFISISDLAISTFSTFSITENPEGLTELRGVYIEAFSDKGENYALYYRGNIEELKETSIIETSVGIPLGTMNKTDSSGTEKTYVVLAVSNISLQPEKTE